VDKFWVNFVNCEIIDPNLILVYSPNLFNTENMEARLILTITVRFEFASFS